MTNEKRFTSALLAAVLIIAAVAASLTFAARANALGLLDPPGDESGSDTTTEAADTTTEAPETTTEAPETAETPATSDTDVAPDGIMFTTEEYALGIGKSVTLEVVVSPDGAELPELTYSSSAPGTVSVDKNGKATALKSGKATITASNDDGSLTCTCLIIATSSGIQLEVLANTGEKIACGFSIGMTVGDVIAEIAAMSDVEESKVTVTTTEGVAAGTGVSIATGMVIGIDGADYTVILFGDVSGDGKINSEDTKAVADYVTGKNETLSASQRLAADVLHEGDVTIENALVIQRHIYGYATITQQI